MTIIQYIQVFLCDIMYFKTLFIIGGDNITNIPAEIAPVTYGYK